MCDRYVDGERAKISIVYGNGSTVTDYLEATGGASTCETGGVGTNIPEGNKVTIKVWHQNGAFGTPQNVDTSYGYA
ncbi:hypothetical protein ABT090_33530 [Streptomyces asoensis]|uniref:hypothetical protein n=1 Tax=Streptomyces asoensis TaxID=249586 RepID=UPI00332A610B